MATNMTMSMDEMVEAAKLYDFVRFSWSDMHGVHRSKMVKREFVASYMRGHGIGLYEGVLAFGPLCELYIPDAMGERGCNGFVKVVPGTLRPVPWVGEDKYQVGEALCELTWNDHTPQDVCPRYVARQQLQRLEKEHGWTIKTAFEAEFCLYDKNDNSPVFKHDQLYTTMVMAPLTTLLMDVATQASKMNVVIEKFHTEYGEGKFEFNLAPTEGISSADGMFTFKQVLKELCLQRGIAATFMSQAFADAPTTGLHLNHSIWDANGHNVFFDANADDNLSGIARYWIAGLIEHSAALAAFACPTVNCFRRLHTFFAPKKPQWAIDARWACYRIKNDDEKHTYVESRLPGGCANPYLLIASHIAAGMDGVRRKLPLPPAMQEDATELPNTLEEALDALKKDQVLCEQLSPRLVDWFINSKTHIELEAFKDHKMRSNIPEEINKEREMYFVL